jgi:sugar lactone lactonase YvrE
MVTKMREKVLKGAIVLALVTAFGAAQAAHAASTWLASIPSDVPARLAVDGKLDLYVAEARGKNVLRVYDRAGKLLRTLPGLQSPSGVALDAQGRIYLGNLKKDSVDVYNADLSYSHALGIGNGEFKAPHSIAVASNGQVYVSDSKDNKVKVYNANGTPAFSFGGFGKGDGQFNMPLSLAINESRSELYVLDWQLVTTSEGEALGARVQVFDLAGKHLRSFGQQGTGVGKMFRPLDMALGRDGLVYVADGYQGVVHVFDANGASVETIFDAAHPTKTPIGLAVGKDNRVFIASNNQKNVEVFGMTGYTTMDVSPATLAFTATAGSAVPAQTVTVVISGSGTLGWTATDDRSWIAVNKTDATTLSVSLDTKGLVPGLHSGTVTITATETGAVETVAVALTVTEPPAVLNVTPAAGLAFKAQQNGPAPAAQTIDIRNLGGGVLTWTAAKNAGWLSLSAAAGAAPSQVLAEITTALPVGTHSDTVTITAQGAERSPVTVPVTVTVTDTGTLSVTTNLTQATYTITGPAPSTTSATVTGTAWKNEEAAPGEYTIAFEHVSGYKRPQTRTVTVTTGKETPVKADYMKKAGATHIVAVTGPAQDKAVTVLTTAGEVVATFKPFSQPAAELQAAVGDLDGTGAEEIAVSDGVRTVKVYSVSGAELAALSLSKWQKGTVIAVGDADNDGKADILAGSVVKRLNRTDVRQVQRYSMNAGRLEDKGTILSEEAAGGYSLAVGDLNGDLLNEVVVADGGGVRAYGMAGGQLVQSWSMQGSFGALPAVAAGDLDDDGVAEIALSIPGVIQILKGTGEPTGVQIATPKAKTNPEAASVAMGDVDGDGADEIAAGTTAGSVQIYEGDGTASGAAITIPGADGQTSVCLGRL